MTKTLAGFSLILLALLGYQWGQAEQQSRRADRAANELAGWKKAYQDEANARGTEKARADLIQEALNAERTTRLSLEADVRRADASARSLRERARQLADASRQACPPVAASAGSAPAEAPADLLAGMLGRIDEAAGELARYADDARTAGQLCERIYDSMKATE